MTRTRLFVSYCHEDRSWLSRFQTHVAVLQRKGLVDLWSDERIIGGADWAGEIESALTAARVAVLLVSPGFLASRFIWEREMPRIIAHTKSGMDALPLILRPCAWQLQEELARLQARPVDGVPLSLGNDAEVDLKLTAFVYELAKRVGHSPAAAGVPYKSDVITARSEISSLSGRWNGHYNDTQPISLVVEPVAGDTFKGRMEYVGERTLTDVEGKFFDRSFATDPIWEQVVNGALSDIHFVAHFRETQYLEKGSKPISFDGEYRVAFQGDKAIGAWFSDNRLVGRLTFRRQATS